MEHDNATLRAQTFQPVLQKIADLLLQQHLADLIGDRIQLWRRRMLARVLRQQSLVIVSLNLLWRDIDAHLESVLNEREHGHALLPAREEGSLCEAVLREEAIP